MPALANDFAQLVPDPVQAPVHAYVGVPLTPLLLTFHVIVAPTDAEAGNTVHLADMGEAVAVI